MPIVQRVRQSRNGTCVLLRDLPFSLAVSLFLGPSRTLQSAVPASPSPSTPSPSSVIASSPSSKPFNSRSAELSSLSLLHFVLGLTSSFVTLDPLTVLAN